MLVAQERGVHMRPDIQEYVGTIDNRGHHPHPLLVDADFLAVLAPGLRDHLLGHQRAERLVRRLVEIVVIAKAALAIVGEEHRFLQVAKHGLAAQIIVEPLAILLDRRQLGADILGHRRGGIDPPGDDLLLRLAHDRHRVAERLARPVGHPEFGGGLEHHRGRDDRQHDRHAGGQREDRDEAHVQAPAATHGRPGRAAHRHPPADQHHQGDTRCQVERQQAGDHRRRDQPARVVMLRQDAVGDDAEHDRNQNHQQFDHGRDREAGAR